MSENKIDKNMVILSLITWVAVAVSAVAMVAYAGIPGVVFAFIVLVVALGTWSGMLRHYNQSKGNNNSNELSNDIKELTKQIEELKKSLEE